jgi:hypothetical protein
MEKTIRVFKSFEEQERDEVQYWKNISGSKKLEVLEIIRAQYWALKNGNPERLQRIYRIIDRVSS